MGKGKHQLCLQTAFSLPPRPPSIPNSIPCVLFSKNKFENETVTEAK